MKLEVRSKCWTSVSRVYGSFFLGGWVGGGLGFRVSDLGFQAGQGSGYSFQGERGAQSSRERHSVRIS